MKQNRLTCMVVYRVIEEFIEQYIVRFRSHLMFTAGLSIYNIR
ncbi:hypothetical protein [Segetibacter sp. 3557_3]|nr:hypothetical protein [Segetibacter sp. 3557_3]